MFKKCIMKRFLVFFCVCGFIFSIKAQTITLEQCQELARENYPLLSQRGLIEKTSEFTVSNAKRNWLPQVSLSAQASYQSDVAAFPDEMQNLLKLTGLEFEGLHKDQYKAVLQVEQIIYGGGAVKAQVETAKAESEANKQNWESEMYSLRDRINQLYFGTLLLQEKIKEADIMIEELNRNLKIMQAYMANGVSAQNDVDKIRVEILSAKQQKSTLVSSKKAYRTMLGIMINQYIADETEFLKPKVQAVPNEIRINRPELNYFDAQEKVLDAQRKGIDAMIKPQIGAFFQGAYANPGLDLFADMQKNQWSPYFIAGVQFKWNISGFYTRKSNLSKIDLTRLQIALQRETFLYNMNLQSTQELIGINRMYEVMQQDDEIIELRTSIRKRTEVGIENGTATVNDLLGNMHSESLARQNKLTHEIDLLKSIYDLKQTTGFINSSQTDF